MLVEKPRPAVELTTFRAENDLFDGLSFPEVPSAPIVIQETAPSAPPLPLKVDESSRNIAPGITGTPGIAHDIAPAVSPVVNGSSLATLYATEIVTNDTPQLYAYPDLPNISTANVSNRWNEDESETTGLLSNVRSDEQVPAVGSSDLVSDLVRENTRLADEILALRRMLEDQRGANSTSSAVAGGNAAIHQIMTQHSANSNATSSTLVHANSSSAVGAVGGHVHHPRLATNSVTGVSVSDTSKPPEKGVKYVCCGGCRQWLMAPRDSVYVVCSACDSINNCNLAPKDNAELHNVATETRALTNQNNESGPLWFIECMTKALF